MLIVVDRSGGRPEWDRRVFAALPRNGRRFGQLVELIDWADEEAAVRVATSALPVSANAILTVFAHWFAYRVWFRGGWTIHIDSPGRDPIKVRCKDHAAALALAHDLSSSITTNGLHVLDSTL